MDPITRKETFLAKAGGQDVTTPTPVTREEYFLNEIANGGGGGERTVVPVTFEWDVQGKHYLPANVPVDVYNHPEKYDLLCTFSGGEYDFTTTMFRYGVNFNNPFYFGIMGYEELSNFAVSIPTPDVGAEVTPAYFVGKNDNKFIVTLTPTAQDFSGTMDKTVAEMTEAYNAGMQIVWRVIIAQNEYVDVDVTAVLTFTTADYPSFNAYIIETGNGVLVYAYTDPTDDGTVQTYLTELYALTPLS